MEGYKRNHTSSRPQKISRAVGKERETPWDDPHSNRPKPSPANDQERGPSRDSGIEVDDRVISPTHREFTGTQRKRTDQNSNIMKPHVTPLLIDSRSRKNRKWCSTPRETQTGPREIQRSISAEPERLVRYTLKDRFTRRATSPDAVTLALLPNRNKAPISPLSMESLP